MAAQDTTALKEKIVSIIKSRGPSFPAHISSQVGMSILFTSAFLSELLSEKKLKISNMRVGSSPLYFIPGQEPLLERYSHSLKSREKDAFEMLKDKKFLVDNEQEPAIRVAIRAIKDFAIPFEKNDKLYWRYLTASENELIVKDSEKKIEKKEVKKDEPRSKTESLASSASETGSERKKEKDLGILEKPKPVKKKAPVKKKSAPKKKPSNNGKNDKFFNKVKEYLLEKEIEISDIISFSKDDLVLKVKENEVGSMVFAYNKKRVNEEDIVKAHKKIADFGLGYSILCLGEPAKKTTNLIEAIKGLNNIENIN
jgi:hypothetical protein